MIRAALAYCNSFILFKLLILNDNCLRLFLACRKKEMEKKKPIKSEKKTLATFFTKIRIPKRISRKRALHILTTLLSRCCKVLPFFNFFSRIFRLRFLF